MAGNEDFSYVSDEELNEGHLLSVVKALYDAGVTDKVKSIGMSLRVDHLLCSRYEDDHDKRLYCVMGGWLRKEFIDTHKDDSPSWRALVVAVKAPAGGGSGAGAVKIAKHYKAYMKDDNKSDYRDADSTPWEDQNHLADILEALERVNARWYQIGVALGLPTNTLDKKKDLGGMISWWLDNGKNPCWRQLLIAVAAPHGGRNPALAQELLEKHKRVQDATTGQPEAQSQGTD